MNLDIFSCVLKPLVNYPSSSFCMNKNNELIFRMLLSNLYCLRNLICFNVVISTIIIIPNIMYVKLTWSVIRIN